MANIKELIFPYSQVGLTTVCIVMKQVATGYFLDHVDGVYRAIPVNPYVPLAELSSPEQGTYERDEDRTAWADGLYRGLVYPDATGTKAPIGSEEMYIKDDIEVDIGNMDLANIGSGDTAVNHNTGGVDNLRYVYQGQGIDNAIIKIYLKSDYDAGNMSNAYVKARSMTKIDGRWQWPVYLDSGFTYSFIFYKQGIYSPTKKDVTI